MKEQNNVNPEINNHTNDNLIVIKARFKSTSMNLYGQMLLSFKADKSIDLCNTVVSTFSDVYDLEPHSGWDKYEEIIADNIWKGNYNQNITSSLMDQFKKLHEEHGQLDLLYTNAYNYDYDNLDISLYDLINRIIHDKNLILESGIQEITKNDIEDVRNKRLKRWLTAP